MITRNRENRESTKSQDDLGTQQVEETEGTSTPQTSSNQTTFLLCLKRIPSLC